MLSFLFHLEEVIKEESRNM